MKKILLIALAVITVFSIAMSSVITQDGAQVTPLGEGTVTLDAGTFEAFPLPQYAAEHLTEDYKSYFVEVEPGIKVHVLEVGTGFPVFMLHGNPTSGFLYRKIAEELPKDRVRLIAEELPKDRVRLIMPTMVGLGFSSKVPASGHTVDNHMRWINSVLVQLQITELVYSGQDWGGPVGMGALSLSPGLIKGAVMLNTGFGAPTEPVNLSVPHALVKIPVFGELMLEVFFSIFEGMHRLQGDRDQLTADEANLYGKPVLESGNAKAPLAMMRMVPDGPDHPSTPAMRTIVNYVWDLDIPAEIVWGMKDPILALGLPAMKKFFPEAPVTETLGGHFLQEEVPVEIATAVLRVVDQVQASTDESP